MDDSDDEEYVFYGTALDPIEEDEPVRKRPITVEEMEATDKQGRRRFHGAFTGGFSAGFYNTVGSLEGWKPSTFKSSRSERAKLSSQAPEDFMDEEDTDEFGIAPKALQARPEYGGGRKREREVGISFHSGPIPGEPVLKSILKPARETVGMLLLIKMGWRAGQGVGPRLTRLQRRAKRARVYSCAQLPADSSSEDSGDELVAPEDLPGAERPVAKEDCAGLGYVGLAKPEGQVTTASNPFTFVDSKNRRLAIGGQAFGVGVFEEEDENIYSIEDKSNYDFSLEPVSSSKKKSRFSDGKKPLPITDGSTVLAGFVAAKEIVRKKFFPPPVLPLGYTPVHQVKMSRFNPVTVPLHKGPQSQLDATSRAAIIDPSSVRIKVESQEAVQEEVAVSTVSEPGWSPFSADPEKQERYDRFLHLVKIGAKDAFSRIQPHTMTDIERERELSEFETAAKLYKPLAGFLKERFTHGGVKEEREIKPEAWGKVECLLITKETWYPHDLVCKRFNIPNPHGERGGEMLNAAKETQKRRKFNLFDFLAKPAEEEEPETSEGRSTSPLVPGTSDEDVHEKTQDAPVSIPENLLDEDPPNKMDLYKAIFESSDEEEKEEEKEVPPPQVPVVNALRNTSPPRGIFANLDLDAINRRPAIHKEETTPELKVPDPKSKPEEPKSDEEIITSPVDPSELFGPALPTKPLFIKTYKNVCLDVEDDRWVEKTSHKSEKLKHKHKKHKKEKKKKKEKHKKKKKSKHSDSD